jgi:dTDP-4-amino-4,6-dideoxygalactose transaminase
MMKGIPAVLGGEGAFAEPIEFVRPTVPTIEALENEVRDMLATGRLTKGPHVERFEEALADHLGVKHAIAVSNCTTGLMLAYQGLELEGDVVVPSFTFMATVSALVWAGLRPVFADVNVDTTNLDPAAVEKAITRRTTAIVAVHNFGNPAPIKELSALARRRALRLVFDAAPAFGALYQGLPVGGQGDAQVFSLSPTKLLVAGEGGVVATNHDALAQRIRWGREYGNDGTYDSQFAGVNGRMPEFNALLGLHGLEILEAVVQRRNELAQLYRDELRFLPGLKFIEVQEGNRCSYKDFSIVIDSEAFGVDRDQLAYALSLENVDTRRYFYPAVHRQRAYRYYAQAHHDLPNTDHLAERSLSLPMGAQVDEEVALQICRTIRQLHEYADEVRVSLRLRCYEGRISDGRACRKGATLGPLRGRRNAGVGVGFFRKGRGPRLRREWWSR